jgi:hypothetical protein
MYSLVEGKRMAKDKITTNRDEKRAKSLANLKPFQSGNNANPTGRPKMPDSLKQAFRGKLTDLAVKALESILDGSNVDAKPSDLIKASEIVMDRAWGKPVQEVDATVDAKMRFISIGVPAFLEQPKPEGEDDT